MKFGMVVSYQSLASRVRRRVRGRVQEPDSTLGRAADSWRPRGSRKECLEKKDRRVPVKISILLVKMLCFWWNFSLTY